MTTGAGWTNNLDGTFKVWWWPKGTKHIVRSSNAKSRKTDYAGCVRFCKRHGLTPPVIRNSDVVSVEVRRIPND